MNTKIQIRAAMKTMMAGLSAQQRHEKSLAACELMAGSREFRMAAMVMLFLSMDGEVESATLAVRAWQEGKSVVVPRVQWETRRMEPVEIHSLDTAETAPGRGFREPVSGRVVPLGFIDMVIIPGLAFDRRGYRVGRGRGFYDRFLSQKDFRGVRAALCFHEQLLEEDLPSEAHDIPMDLIITDRELLRINGREGRT